MTIIVEDGSIVAGANSYVSLADARALLVQYGLNLNADDSIAETQLLQGAKYVDSFRDCFQGTKVEATQPMQWPRVGVYIDGFLFPSDAIPQEVINAQCFAANAVEQGIDLWQISDGRITTLERVEGAVTVEYSDSSAANGFQSIGRVDDELAPLCGGSGFGTMRTKRV